MPRLSRTNIIHGTLMVFAGALVVRAAYVQLAQGRQWAERARRQQFVHADLPGPRGTIFDMTRVPLAESRALVAIGIAPREVRARDRGQLGRALVRLGVPPLVVGHATDTTRRWVTIPGTFLPGDAAALTAIRGVHPAPVLVRAYASCQSTRRIVGHLDYAGVPVDGLEAGLDEVLRGTPGREVVSRDARGRVSLAQDAESIVPQPGQDVVLTINQQLQEIAERALQAAVAELGAEGGDIVVLDPRSGEIRALATIRHDAALSGSPALSEPFEPGSTLKPFMAATLLSLGRARADEVMNTENGTYTIAGRTIHDVHRAPQLTLRDVIAYSSNIGIVKFSSRLSRSEQYQALRDVGFGTPTGLPYPGEAAGRLRPPARWSRQSPASLAMGYEISVTAVQLALAYATFANGGLLLEPALVAEIRTPDGTLRYRHERRIVRRVMSEQVAATVREMLRGSVAGGTASEAGLGTFEVAGKTGTARRAVRGHYLTGQYTASFVGLFPADRPQYVIVVKLDHPTSAIYGGKTAAPVSKTVLEAALAARDAALDLGALVASVRRSPPGPVTTAGDAAVAPAPVVSRADTAAMDSAWHAATSAPSPDSDRAPEASVIVLPPPPVRSGVRWASRSVPSVYGLPLRQAARALHLAGFRVRLTGSGTAVSTWPAAGTPRPSGTLVRLIARP